MSLFYERDGKGYWKCAWCSREHAQVDRGAYVQVANVVLGIVCMDFCLPHATAGITRYLAKGQTP